MREVFTYLDRHNLAYERLGSQLDSIASGRSTSERIDDLLIGLRASPLDSPGGGDEYLVYLADEQTPDADYFAIAVLNCDLAVLRKELDKTDYRFRINKVVGQMLLRRRR